MKWLIVIIILIFLYYYWQPRELYFDNNATTRPHGEVYAAIAYGGTLGNASAFYAGAAKNAVETLKKMVLHKLGKPGHRCILTSGASESNNLLFRGFSLCDSKMDSYNGRIWCSAWEHKSSLECAKEMQGLIIHDGQYNPNRGDLVSVMTMNNETGNIFDIWAIARHCKKRGAWFHTDITQYFGKITAADDFSDIDCFSLSFHKLYMLPGLGALIIPQEMQIAALISGTQNDGLRGGTESVPLVCGAIKSMEITFHNRAQKNHILRNITAKFKNLLAKYRTVSPMCDWVGLTNVEAVKKALSGPPLVIFIDIPGTASAPNTALVAFVNNVAGSRFCNMKFREELTKRDVKISIGSACNTSQKGASHVLTELRLPFLVRAGVVRFSFGDYNTMAEIDEFERRCRDLLR
jgi:cysteine desulfurase